MKSEKPVVITIRGSSANRYRAFRTSGTDEKYSEIGQFETYNGEIIYTAPANSVTTFFANR
jgi:hypothetical protein